jgi:hypothetical protein
MRHLKDIALFLVTVWAAFLIAGVVAMMVIALRPGISEEGAGFLYISVLFVTAAAGGGLLMTHLHWSRRLLVLALLPALLTVVFVVGRAATTSVSGSVIDKLLFMTEAHLPWFVASAAIAFGAVIARWRAATRHSPNNTMEPTR